MSAASTGCRCDACGTTFCVDVLVDADTWDRIRPKWKVTDGLLCPNCIMRRIEGLGEFAAFRLEPVRDRGRHLKPFLIAASISAALFYGALSYFGLPPFHVEPPYKVLKVRNVNKDQARHPSAVVRIGGNHW